MRGVLISIVLMLTTTVRAADLPLGTDARTALQLTVYADGFAYIQDTRKAMLPAGAARLAFTDVSPRLVPASALMRSSDDVRIAEIAYALERLSPESLLRHSVGRTVDVVRTHPTTGIDESETAKVLAVDGGVVLRYREHIESGVPGRLIFREIPEGLAAEPALIAAVDAGPGGERHFDLGYLSEGLDWSADYAVELDEGAHRLTLAGRALLTNTTGIGFAGAQVGLIAGTVQHEIEPSPAPRAAVAMARMADAGAPAPAREQVADLHLYALPGTLSLPDRQTKQVPLLSRAAVAFTKEYVSVHAVQLYAGDGREPQPEHPEVRYGFRNGDAGAGEPLPAGIARLYVRDKDGYLRPIGEDRIEHTAAGAEVRLSPARAFDITIVRRQTEFQEIGGKETGAVEAAWRVEVSNARREDAAVRLVAVMPGSWTVLAESTPHENETARRPVWRLVVPAGGAAHLDYRLRLQR